MKYYQSRTRSQVNLTQVQDRVLAVRVRETETGLESSSPANCRLVASPFEIQKSHTLQNPRTALVADTRILLKGFSEMSKPNNFLYIHFYIEDKHE